MLSTIVKLLTWVKHEIYEISSFLYSVSTQHVLNALL